MFSFSSVDLGTLACTGAIFPGTPGLLEFGKGFVTLELAIAEAITLEVDASPFSSPFIVSSLILVEDEGNGLEGLKTGAEADIFEAFAEGAGACEPDARRFGGVLDLADIVNE